MVLTSFGLVLSAYGWGAWHADALPAWIAVTVGSVGVLLLLGAAMPAVGRRWRAPVWALEGTALVLGGVTVAAAAIGSVSVTAITLLGAMTLAAIVAQHLLRQRAARRRWRRMMAAYVRD